MDIRKISIGPDYKNGAMHYLVGQKILGDSNEIHLIKHDESINCILIYIINENLNPIYLFRKSTLQSNVEFTKKIY